MSDEFYVEPWKVTRTEDRLILADETPSQLHYGGAAACAAIAIVVIVTFPTIGAWLGFTADDWFFTVFQWGFAILLLLKAGQQIRQAWSGPIVYEFDEPTQTLLRNGEMFCPISELKAIKIHQTTTPHHEGQGRNKTKSVELLFANRRVMLGDYGDSEAADRLAQAIAEFTHAPLIRKRGTGADD